MLDETTVESAAPPDVLAAEPEETTAETAVVEEDSAASESAEVEPETLEAQPEEDDPFLELEDQPRTREVLDKLFPRIPKEAREEWGKDLEQFAAAREQLQKVGGEDGITFAETVVPLLNNPNPSENEADIAFEAFAERNPALLAAMGNRLLNVALTNERTGESMANNLIREEFGEGYDLATIHKLVGFHRGGLMDMDAFDKAAASVGLDKPSPIVEKLQSELTKANERIGQLEGKTNSVEQAEVTQAKAKADEWLSGEVMRGIPKLAEKYGWMPKDGGDKRTNSALVRLGQLVTAHLDRVSKEAPEYANYLYLRDEQKKVLGPDGKPHYLATKQATPLSARAEAEFIQIVKDLQPLINDGLRYKSAPRRQVKTSEAATRTTERKPAPQPRAESSGFNWDDPKYQFNPNRVDEIVQKAQAKAADSRVRVGQR
jgi:hypothetical protein